MGFRIPPAVLLDITSQTPCPYVQVLNLLLRSGCSAVSHLCFVLDHQNVVIVSVGQGEREHCRTKLGWAVNK